MHNGTVAAIGSWRGYIYGRVILLVPAVAFRLTEGQLCYHFTPTWRAANTNAASALTAVRDLPVENLMNGLKTLLESLQAVWTIQAGFARK
jgi:hypothetical protein